MTRKPILAVALAVLLVLAGCSGGGTGTPTDATDAATDAPTATPTATETTTSAPSTTSGESSSYDADALRSAVTGAIDDLDAYRIDAEVDAVLKGPTTQEISQNLSTLVDRQGRELSRTVTTNAMGRSSESTAYVVDETLYLRSPTNVRQYSSEWIQLGVSSNFSQYWNSQDTLGQIRGIVENAATVEVAGNDTVDGTRTATLSIDVSPAEFQSLLGNAGSTLQGANVTVESARYTLQVDPETGRVLAGTSRVNSTVVVRSQSLQQNSTTTYRFEYDVDGSVTLPDAAKDAYNVSEESQGTTTESRIRSPSPAVERPGFAVLAADP